MAYLGCGEQGRSPPSQPFANRADGGASERITVDTGVNSPDATQSFAGAGRAACVTCTTSGGPKRDEIAALMPLESAHPSWSCHHLRGSATPSKKPGCAALRGVEGKPSDAPRPGRRLSLDGFWMDAHPVTAGEFRRFVRASGHVTVAERPLVADDYPGADPELLVPGSLVFRQTARPVDLSDPRNWTRWVGRSSG